jgi:hypothetical protein
MSAVRRLAAGESPALAAIVRGLPEYFTDDVPGKVEHDAASHGTWVITDDGTITGFVIAARKSPGGAEILWIAGWPPGNPAAIYAAAIRPTRGEP